MKLVNMTKRGAGEYTMMIRGAEVAFTLASLGTIRTGRNLRTKHWTAATVDGAVTSDPWPTMTEALAEIDSLLASRAS